MTEALAGFNQKSTSRINLQDGCGGGIVIIPDIPWIDKLVDGVSEAKDKIIAFVNTAKKQEYRNQSVYVLKNSAGEVRYVGRTNNPERRAKEHKNDPLHPQRRSYTMTVVATGLSLQDAMLFEQALISTYSLQYLENMRREISRGNLAGYYHNADAIIELVGGISVNELFDLLGG